MRISTARMARRAGLGLIVMAGLRGSAADLPPPTLPGPAREIALYQGVAPGSEKWDWREQLISLSASWHFGPAGVPTVINVVRPVLQYYPASKATAVGTAVIVAPGGGFKILAIAYEGVDVARRLNKMGIDSFVLKYRLVHIDPTRPPPPSPKLFSNAGIVTTGAQAGLDLSEVGGADARQAVRVLRERAAEFGVSPNRIGMVGFSAGGYVTISAVMGPVETRPNFAAAIYGTWWKSATPPSGAPPLFLAIAANDRFTDEAVELYRAWHQADVPVELHVFQSGGHGFQKRGGGGDHFMDRLQEWLKLNGWLTKDAN